MSNYPKTLIVKFFPDDADTRDLFLMDYAVEYVVDSKDAEIEVLGNINHEANVIIEEL